MGVCTSQDEPLYPTVSHKTVSMRPEIQRYVEETKQAVDLLRRHL
jgi:hypothetical protein